MEKEKGYCPKIKFPNSYTPQITIKEITEEVDGIPTLKEVLAEQVLPVSDYYTEKEFLIDFFKRIKSDKEYVATKAWNRIYRYFSTNSKFEYMSIKDTLDYLNVLINSETLKKK